MQSFFHYQTLLSFTTVCPSKQEKVRLPVLEGKLREAILNPTHYFTGGTVQEMVCPSSKPPVYHPERVSFREHGSIEWNFRFSAR